MTENLRSEERAVFALRRLYRAYGYLPYKMNQFESYDFYLRNKDFLVSDRIITFSDQGGRLLALKPDVTLSIVKNAPEEPGQVRKLYYNENVYRDYREILQTGLECVGDLGSYEIAEVVTLAAGSLAALGENYVLDVSHMGLVGAVLDSCGFAGDQRQEALDCLMHKSAHELKALCPGESSWEKLRTLSTCRGTGREVLEKIAAVLTTEEERQALEELKDLWDIVEESGYSDHVRLDFSVGNHLGYYSGVVFRGYLEGIYTAVLSGGQYDALARKLGKNSRAIGFAVYVDNLQEEDVSTDVDTLILHDGTVDTGVLAQAAREAEKTGSVLVSRSIPTDRNYKTILRFEAGKAVAGC